MADSIKQKFLKKELFWGLFFFFAGTVIYTEAFSGLNNFIVDFWKNIPWREGTERWRSGFTVSGWFFWILGLMSLFAGIEQVKKFIHKLFLNKIAYTILFIVLFFVVRTPFYSTGMVAEDGLFANILINHPESPDYCLIGRINGEEILEPIQHPGLIYEPIAVLGDFSHLFLDYNSMSREETTFWSRIMYSFFQLFFWMLLVLYIVRLNKGFWFESGRLSLLYGLIFFAILPIALNNSIDLQIDSSTGVIYNGIMGLAVLIFMKKRDRTGYVILFAGSVIAGFGKNEWGIILLMTVAAALLYFVIIAVLKRLNGNGKEYLLFLGTIVAGLTIGSVINYLFDPVNYIAGIKLLTKMSGRASLISTGDFGWWLQITKGRLGYIISNIVMILTIAGYFIKKAWKGDFYRTFLFGYSLAFFFSFFIAMYERTARYYASSFVTLVLCCVLFIDDYKGGKVRNYAVTLLLLLGLAYSGLYISDRLNTVKHYDVVRIKHKRHLRSVERQIRNGCVPLKSSSDGYFDKDDFIADSLGRVVAEKLAEKYNKEVCK